MTRKITLAQKKKIHELNKTGVTIENLAERFGVSKSFIRNVLSKARKMEKENKNGIS